MEQQKLVDYLKKYLSEGYPLAELKVHLQKNGVSLQEIDSALNLLQKLQKKQPEIINEAPIEINILAGIYFMFAAMLIIYSSMVFISQNYLPQSEGIRNLIGEPSYFAFFLLAVGSLSAVVGYGILRVKPWAKTEGMLISFAVALTVIGIIVTIMTLYFFSRQEVKEAFEHSSHLRKEAQEIKNENSVS